MKKEIPSSQVTITVSRYFEEMLNRCNGLSKLGIKAGHKLGNANPESEKKRTPPLEEESQTSKVSTTILVLFAFHVATRVSLRLG